MSRSIRKRIGGGAAALALVFFAVVVGGHFAGAGSAKSTQLTVASSHEGTQALVVSHVVATKAKVAAVRHAVTPTAGCAAARQALAAWKAKDKAEDAAERAAAKSDPNFKTTDAAEDKAELAEVKPLMDAVRTACGLTKPTPSAACVSATQALKAWFAKDRIQDAATKAAGTTESAAQRAAEKAEVTPLSGAVRTACFGSAGPFLRPHATTFTYRH